MNRELLDLLVRNARQSNQDLADQLGLSAEAVADQIAELEAAGVVRGYQAIINEDQVESPSVVAVIEVKVIPEREGGFNRLALRISRFPEARSVYLMSGAMDLLVFVEGRDLREISSFVSEKLAPMEGVSGTRTHFLMKTYKHRGVLMDHEDEFEKLKVTP